MSFVALDRIPGFVGVFLIRICIILKDFFNVSIFFFLLYLILICFHHFGFLFSFFFSLCILVGISCFLACTFCGYILLCFYHSFASLLVLFSYASLFTLWGKRLRYEEAGVGKWLKKGFCSAEVFHLPCLFVLWWVALMAWECMVMLMVVCGKNGKLRVVAVTLTNIQQRVWNVGIPHSVFIVVRTSQKHTCFSV